MPHHLISKLAKLLASCRWIWLKNYLIRYFLARYSVNMDEAEITDPLQYPSFNAFFTRALKPSARPQLKGSPYFISSPVDGCISQATQIKEGQLIQAKSHTYSVQALLGGDKTLANVFHSGHFTTLYLAPTDYHRVHMPIDGTLTQMIYVPGRLFSVNQLTVSQVPQLFARNERVVCIFETNTGKVAIVLVGAMIVGSIATTWAGLVVPRKSKSIERWHYTTQQPHNFIHLKRGEEMGRFLLGSTVILLFENPTMTWAPSVHLDSLIQLHQPLGQFNGHY